MPPKSNRRAPVLRASMMHRQRRAYAAWDARHAALLSLADAPAGVFVERAEERVLARPEVELERRQHGLDVLAAPEAGLLKRRRGEGGLKLGIGLDEDRAAPTRESRERGERGR